MTYLQILHYARKGILAEQTKLRKMQDKAIEGSGTHSQARALASHLQEQINVSPESIAGKSG